MAESDVTRECSTGQFSFNPRTDLTDVALYSYAGLCAYALGKLYEGSPHDRELVEKWITKITEHNGQGDTSRATMQALARAEVQLDNADPFVESLKTDPYISQYGAKPVIQDAMCMTIKDGCYDSRLRTLLKYLCLLLKVNWFELEVYENAIVKNLQEEEHVPTEEEIKEKNTQDKKRKIKRYALISAAAIGGGALMGLTGGLAAPFIAAGAGAIIGGAGATALASTAGIAIIGSLFGVAGLGLGGYKMQKRVGNIEEFEFEPLSEGRQLHITIAVSGWLTDKLPEFKTAWLGLANSKEQYVLKYESKYLLKMGKALDYLVGIAINAATQEALKYTILSGLLSAIAWPATLLAAASVIDNPWNVCTHRSVNVGRQLADVLLSRQQGKRPVTLIGFSLGARVIFYCLQEMAKRKNCEGIIEDVILLGAPVTGNAKEWEPLARVVAGKIVNGYCRGDWLLKFLYRTASIQMTIAGLKPVDWENRRMHNIDLSDVVLGHTDYMNKIDDILTVVGIQTREHAIGRAPDSLKAWVQIQKSTSNQSVGDMQTQNSAPLMRNHSVENDDGTVSIQLSHPPAECQTDVTLNSGTVSSLPGGIVKSEGLKQQHKVKKQQQVGELCDKMGTQVQCSSSVSYSSDGLLFHDSSSSSSSSSSSPPIQSNNLVRQLQLMALTESGHSDNSQGILASTPPASPNAMPNITDINKSDSTQSTCADSLNSGVSNVSSQVTTPDSGISCDD